MVEKLKQLVEAYKDEYATLDASSPVRGRDPIVEAKKDVVRRHAIQLQGVIEGECTEYVDLVKSFG